ncbi:MAG: hypothetical protein D6780_07095 [Candidatus Dadabacteria bacterium]|nr:MAG: hypothetical protein D6780_07095 [Candidatus Dadabacteria bacterium]
MVIKKNKGLLLTMDTQILSTVLGSGPVVKSVLLILILLSIWSWTITIAKTFQLWRASRQTYLFWKIFADTADITFLDEPSRKYSASPLALLFAAGYRELVKTLREAEGGEGKTFHLEGKLEHLEKSLDRSRYWISKELEKGLTFLASVASAAPFIGLFGTVWGIMNAFHGLQFVKNTTIQAVAPGISEALIATAVGLAAAIPAAVAYNYFIAAVKKQKEAMYEFSREFVLLAKNYFREE